MLYATDNVVESKMKTLITTTTPTSFFEFLETVASLQESTLKQILSCMKSIWGPVRAAKAFSVHYGFVESDGDKLKLTTLGKRLLAYTGTARSDFLIFSIKLQEKKPFFFLKKELEKNKVLKITRMGELLRVKFRPTESWSKEKMERIGNVYVQWLISLRQAELDESSVKYVGGAVKTFEVLIIPEMCDLLDRTLYDYLIEKFHTPHNILKKPHESLQKVETTTNDNEKGNAFEDFVARCFRRFGFNPRKRDGIRETMKNLTYKKTKGGGDVGLFCHFPTPTTDKTHEGYAIACEAKAGQHPIGSKAVGQARNLCQKILESFPKYLAHTIVVSRSKSGYDSSGKGQAPPEVLHLNHEILLNLLKMQEDRLKKGLSLITPIHFMIVLKEFIKERKMEPDITEFLEKLKVILD